jgi:membrane protease YdiL (CAAX protease family)
VQVLVIVAGTIAEMAGWWLVSARRRDVWRVMPWVLGIVGCAAALTRRPVLVHGVSVGAALAVGLASGLALYAATRAFVWVASWWPRFRADVADKYAEAATVSLAVSLALSLLVMVPAEEVFWRGLVLGRFAVALSLAAAAGGAWFAYVVANLPSRSLPIVAGAVVGGALWTVLAWWSGGVLASLASHILWTGAMLTLPPGAAREPGPKNRTGPGREHGREDSTT